MPNNILVALLEYFDCLVLVRKQACPFDFNIWHIGMKITVILSKIK